MKLHEHHNIFIVGVGSSGGGSNALCRFISGLPAKSHNFAIIFYYQPDIPDLKPILTHLLGSHSEWVIEYAKHNNKINKGRIYLTPAGYQLFLRENTIKLSRNQGNLSIDAFLTSLALDQKENAIGVLLSGIGRDGVEGIRKIKETGGYVLVQEPSDAEHAALPGNVIACEAIHCVVKASHMIDEIVNYITNFHAGFKITPEIEKSVIQNLVEESDDMFITVDKNYRILALNESASKQFFYLTGQEIKVGDNLLEKIKDNPDVYHQVKAYCERAFNGEKFVVDAHEAKLIITGKKEWYELQFIPIVDNSGKVVGATQISRNITNKVETERKVQEITRRSAYLVGGEFFKDLTEQLALIFKAKYVYIGIFTEEHTKVSSLAFHIDGKLVDNFSYDLANTPCAVVSQNKKTYYFDHVKSRFPEDPKLERWNAESYLGIPIMSPSSDDAIGILVTINDKYWEEVPYADYVLALFATRAGVELERIQSEEKIREKDEQLARVSSNVPGLIYEFRMRPDRSTEFVYISEACYNLVELEPEEVIRDVNKAYARLHPEEWPVFYKTMEHSALTLEHFHYEGRIRTAKSGKIKWIKVDAKPERRDNGDIVWYGFMDDITKLKEVEFELIKAKEESEKAAQVKEDFMSTMSHEIRTPLNAIIGITNLLLNKEPKQDQIENLNTLKFSSENLMNLINDILDFSKLESGKVEIEETSFDLRVLLNSIKQAHLLQATERNNKLIVEVDEKIPAVVLGDQLKLAQIMNNLISNAVKFTLDGFVTIKVKLKHKVGDQLWLHFSVSDTGIGIPEDKLQGIFDKFTQADASTMRKFGGTGLGLTITKMLLELQGSSIQAESCEGKGSTFCFDLKLCEDTLQAEDKQKEEGNRKANLQALGEIKILLVEDVAINRFIVIQYLQTWENIRVDEASNGLEAIEKVKTNSYDIILMDIRMPEMDGYEAAKIIRSFADPKLQRIPIIALTADTVRDLKNENAHTFTDIVTKPFNPDELYAKVIKHTVAVKSKEEAGKEISGDIQLKEMITCRKIEDTLHHDVTRTLNFYKVAEKTLLDYKDKYEVAIQHKDVVEIDNVSHKASLTLKTLGLKILLARLKEGKNLIDKEASEEEIYKLSEDVRLRFDEAIGDIRNRLHEVTHNGLQ